MASVKTHRKLTTAASLWHYQLSVTALEIKEKISNLIRNKFI